MKYNKYQQLFSNYEHLKKEILSIEVVGLSSVSMLFCYFFFICSLINLLTSLQSLNKIMLNIIATDY